LRGEKLADASIAARLLEAAKHSQFLLTDGGAVCEQRSH
jgi:hypothetical protein